MIITPRTMDILTNFVKINEGIVIRAGRTLSTIAPGKQLLAKADIDAEFPMDVAIADLRFLLQALKNMTQPVMKFDKAGRITITENAKGAKPTRQTIPISSPDLIVHPKVVETMPSIDLTFQIEATDFDDMLTTATRMKYERIEIRGENGVVTLHVAGRRSSKFAGTSGWARDVGTTADTFNFSFFTENFGLIRPDAYTVEMSAEGIAHFVGGLIEYWAVVEEDSFFTPGT